MALSRSPINTPNNAGTAALNKPTKPAARSTCVPGRTRNLTSQHGTEFLRRAVGLVPAKSPPPACAEGREKAADARTAQQKASPPSSPRTIKLQHVMSCHVMSCTAAARRQADRQSSKPCPCIKRRTTK